MKNIYGWLLDNKPRFFLIALLLAAAIVLGFDYRNGFDWNGILVEAHGMLFDVILFGIILNAYEAASISWRRKEEEASERKRLIKHYKEEIDDFRFWEEKEAVFRIVGSIRRLNKQDISKINLFGCYLKGARLWKAKLAEANLGRINLEGANLGRVDLRGANLWNANLEGTMLKEAQAFESQRKYFVEGGASEEEMDTMIWAPDPPVSERHKYLLASGISWIEWEDETVLESAN